MHERHSLLINKVFWEKAMSVPISMIIKMTNFYLRCMYIPRRSRYPLSADNVTKEWRLHVK